MKKRVVISTVGRALGGSGALVFCFVLAACGGGGGGGSSGGGGGTPPPPPITYHGVTVQAPANGTTAIAFGPGVVFAANEVRGLVSGIEPVPPGTYDNDVACADGGSAHVSGTINNDSTGTLKENYHRCSQDENGVVVTLDGLVVLVYHSTSSAKPLDVDVRFESVRVSGGGNNLGLTGDVAKVLTNGDAGIGKTFDADLLLTNSANGAQAWMHPLSIDDEPDRDRGIEFDTTLSGRYYDSAFGYMPLSTFAPLLYADDAAQPFTGGSITLDGKGGHVILSPLNTKYASLGLDFDGDGRIETGNVFDWTTDAFLADENLAPGPVADARTYTGVYSGQLVGQSSDLDARMSRERGNAYLSYHWKLLLSPPGSEAQLEHAHEARASLTPDVPGDYLVRMTVTDRRGHSNTSALRIDAYTSPGEEATWVGAADIGPDETAGVGQLVKLDADKSVTGSPDPSFDNYYWSLTVPPGSHATLQNGYSATPSFTPDVPGIYGIGLSVVSDYGEPFSVTKLVSVGANSVHFDGALLQSQDVDLSDVAVGDFNDDGKPDLAETGSFVVRLIYNEGAGKFSAPVTLTSAIARGITAGDLNGDGLDDLAIGLSMDTVSHVDALVFKQRAGGFDPGEKWTCTGCNFHGAVAPMIAPLFGQPWNSLWMATNSDSLDSPTPYVGFDLDGNGNQDPQYLMPFSQFLQDNEQANYVLADINGDGIRDLAFQFRSNSGTYSLAVSLGQAGRSFAQPKLYDTSFGRIAASDLNDDGLADILSLQPGADKLVVRFGQNNGALSAPVAYATFFDSSSPLWMTPLPNASGLRLTFFAESTTGSDYFLTYFGVNPDGSLGMQWLYPLDGLVFPGVHTELKSADVNGDGIFDLLIADGTGDVAVLFGSPWPARLATSAASEESTAIRPREARAVQLANSAGKLLGRLTPTPRRPRRRQ